MFRLTTFLMCCAAAAALLMVTPTSSTAQCVTCTVAQDCDPGDDGAECRIHYHEGDRWCQWEGACEPQIAMIPAQIGIPAVTATNAGAHSAAPINRSSHLILVRGCTETSVIGLRDISEATLRRESGRVASAPGVTDE